MRFINNNNKEKNMYVTCFTCNMFFLNIICYTFFGFKIKSN